MLRYEASFNFETLRCFVPQHDSAGYMFYQERNS